MNEVKLVCFRKGKGERFVGELKSAGAEFFTYCDK